MALLTNVLYSTVIKVILWGKAGYIIMASQIGRRLKDLRRQAGLSSRAVAERLEMPASTYQKYEDRYRRPYLPLQLVAKLVNALRNEGVSPDSIWALADNDQIAAFHEAWAAKTNPAIPESRRSATVIQFRPPEGAGRRNHERWAPMSARLSADGEEQTCLVKDISKGGACVLAEAAEKLQEAAEILLELSNVGTIPAHVARAQGNEIGLTFEGDGLTERDISTWLSPDRMIRH